MAEYVTCLPQHGYVILTVMLQYFAVMKHTIFLLFVPRQEILSLQMPHVVKAIVNFIWHAVDIIQTRLGFEIGKKDFDTVWPNPRVTCLEASQDSMHC
jgi:hypothetical protein